ncbi:MAG: DUF1828 domain-containing protein [Desulfobacteraceae bacterium]|nr:DUF1828 domain-containing protein [Desulfobacteraceae bacterium]
MEEKTLERSLSEVLVQGWDITGTGNGFLITTDWQLPNSERIEIYARRVGDREDLYVVGDGGELFNLLFANGIDLSKDEQGMKIILRIAENYAAQIVDFQLVKGAKEEELAQAVRMILEAVKDASFLLWHKLDPKGSLH